MADERRAAVLLVPGRTYTNPDDWLTRMPQRRRRARAMTRDDVLGFCAGFPGAVEDYPFGDGVAVFKVGGRMFALVSLEGSPGFVNLKCDPDLALELRARYAAVHPGYHANKRHWNTVDLDGSVEDEALREMIDHSYELVVKSLPRADRARLEGN
jgi:predicted DNA-binding protein (MmcQ/YjbR family)